MSEESTSPDLVERAREAVETGGSGDFDAMVKFFSPDAIWDMSPMGIGVFDGRAAFRGFFEDWQGTFEEFSMQTEQVVNFGNGVTFAVILQSGRPPGGSGQIQLRYGAAAVWTDGLITRITNYSDIDEARAAAERLAQERG